MTDTEFPRIPLSFNEIKYFIRSSDLGGNGRNYWYPILPKLLDSTEHTQNKKLLSWRGFSSPHYTELKKKKIPKFDKQYPESSGYVLLEYPYYETSELAQARWSVASVYHNNLIDKTLNSSDDSNDSIHWNELIDPNISDRLYGLNFSFIKRANIVMKLLLLPHSLCESNGSLNALGEPVRIVRKIENPLFLQPLVQLLCHYALIERLDVCYSTCVHMLFLHPERYFDGSRAAFQALMMQFVEVLSVLCGDFFPGVVVGLQSITGTEFARMLFVDFFQAFFPLDCVLLILDEYMLEGKVVLIRFGLALIAFYRSRIIAKEFSSLETFEQTVKKEINVSNFKYIRLIAHSMNLSSTKRIIRYVASAVKFSTKLSNLWYSGRLFSMACVDMATSMQGCARFRVVTTEYTQLKPPIIPAEVLADLPVAYIQGLSIGPRGGKYSWDGDIPFAAPDKWCTLELCKVSKIISYEHSRILANFLSGSRVHLTANMSWQLVFSTNKGVKSLQAMRESMMGSDSGGRMDMYTDSMFLIFIRCVDQKDTIYGGFVSANPSSSIFDKTDKGSTGIKLSFLFKLSTSAPMCSFGVHSAKSGYDLTPEIECKQDVETEKFPFNLQPTSGDRAASHKQCDCCLQIDDSLHKCGLRICHDDFYVLRCDRHQKINDEYLFMQEHTNTAPNTIDTQPIVPCGCLEDGIISDIEVFRYSVYRRRKSVDLSRMKKEDEIKMKKEDGKVIKEEMNDKDVYNPLVG